MGMKDKAETVELARSRIRQRTALLRQEMLKANNDMEYEGYLYAVRELEKVLRQLPD